ncbi:MAG: type 4a pilus biogenesis protein PilO [bacterium]
MTESKRTLIIAGVLLVVVCLGWYLVFYQPKLTKLRTLKTETENLLIKITSFRVTDKQLASLEKQVEKSEDEIAKIHARVLLKSELPAVVRQFKRKGRSFGLEFHSIIPDYNSLIRIPQEEEEASDLLKLTVHFKLQGYYKNFGNFIDSLAELPFIVSLSEMSLHFNERIYPELEIFMDVVLYLRETSEVNTKI